MTSPDPVAIEAAVAAVLDGLDVPYEILPCDPDFADTAAFCERYGYTLEQSANTIVVASKREPRKYAACVVAGSDRLDVNKTVKRLLGVSRLSFASAEDTLAVTGMMLGGVTVFGLPAGLPIYVDARLMSEEFIILGGGSRSAKVKIAPEALRQIPGLEVVQALAL